MATAPSTPKILNLAELAALRARVAEIEARNEVLAAQLTARDAQLEAAQARLAVLTDQIEELRRRSGRRPGKQPGARSSTLRQSGYPDETVECGPAACRCCGAGLADEPAAGGARTWLSRLRL